jgi:hypothetical protein
VLSRPDRWQFVDQRGRWQYTDRRRLYSLLAAEQ